MMVISLGISRTLVCMATDWMQDLDKVVMFPVNIFIEKHNTDSLIAKNTLAHNYPSLFIHLYKLQEKKN